MSDPVFAVLVCAVCGRGTSKFRIGERVFCSKRCLKEWRKHQKKEAES